MAVWTVALKAIPWAELIAAAPVVARGARKLWTSVRSKDAAEAEGSWPEARLDALEAQLDELRQELTASADLIANLADQNTRLVEAVTVLRMRTRILFVIALVMAAVVAGLLVTVLR
jgi:hypothetical protein